MHVGKARDKNGGDRTLTIGSSNLVAEIVMIPLAAWFVRLLSLRRFLLFCAFGYIASSVVSGISESLGVMIAGRLGQGFFGGALIPTAMTIIATRLPKDKQAAGLGAFGGVAIIAPVLGPLIGGWLTDNLTWRWLFFLNVPVGAVLVALLFRSFPREPIAQKELENIDWLGIVGLVVFCAGSTVALQEGQRLRWLESGLIVSLLLLAVAGAFMVTWSQLSRPEPVVRLRLLRERGFAGAVVISALFGLTMNGVFYVIPVFLGEVAGYTAEQTGFVAMYSAAASMFVIAAVPAMSKKADARILVAAGLLLMAASAFMDVDLTAESGRGEFLAGQLVRGVGLSLVFFPLSEAALARIAPNDSADASGLFNIARNFGGAIGLAGISILLETRQALHGQSIAERLTANSPEAAAAIGGSAGGLMSQHGDQSHAAMQALALLDQQIRVQASVISYSDLFWVSGWAMVLAIPFVLLLSKPKPGGSPAGGLA